MNKILFSALFLSIFANNIMCSENNSSQQGIDTPISSVAMGALNGIERAIVHEISGMLAKKLTQTFFNVDGSATIDDITTARHGIDAVKAASASAKEQNQKAKDSLAAKATVLGIACIASLLLKN